MPQLNYPIDPKAVAIAKVHGMSRDEAADILTEVQMDIPQHLLGGYHLDAVVIALYICLDQDADDQGWTGTDLVERTVAAVEAAYEGAI